MAPVDVRLLEAERALQPRHRVAHGHEEAARAAAVLVLEEILVQVPREPRALRHRPGQPRRAGVRRQQRAAGLQVAAALMPAVEAERVVDETRVRRRAGCRRSAAAELLPFASALDKLGGEL